MAVIDIYCDESRQENLTSKTKEAGSITLIGGLWIREEDRARLKAEIKRIRVKHNAYNELKWTAISPSNQELYIDLVRLFFRENFRFRCIVLPADRLEVGIYHEDDNELMFYKFYYLLLHYWIKPLNEYRIFADQKTNRVRRRLISLRDFLRQQNPGASIRFVQALPSKEVDFIQLADVLIGATGSALSQTTHSEAKLAIVAEIEKRISRKVSATPPNESKYNVFCFEAEQSW